MTEAATEAQRPKPVVNVESQPFWDAAAEGRLLYKTCNACGENHFYPRTLCPFCFSDRTEWREASGEGTLYTYSTMPRAKPPHTLAYVALAEGPRLLTNIVDCEGVSLAIGHAMKLVFKPTEDGRRAPFWTIA